MKTDYITAETLLPSHLIYPRFLLGANVRFTAKEVYTIMLNMTLNSEDVQRHVQQDGVDLLGGKPDACPQQEPGIDQVGRQRGPSGDIISFHLSSPFRVGFHVLFRKIF